MRRFSLLLCALLCSLSSFASYASYVTDSGDGTNFIQTVLVEGSISMACPWQCGQYTYCQPPGGCNAHQPGITNTIGTHGGTTYGGWYTPAQYISYQTTTTAPVAEGDKVATVATWVYCAMAVNLVYSFNPSPIYIHAATTLVKMVPGTETHCFSLVGQGPWCDYTTINWCTPETTPPDWSPAGVVAVPQAHPNPAYYWSTQAVCAGTSAKGPWHCASIGPVGFAGSDSFPRLVCTKTQ